MKRLLMAMALLLVFIVPQAWGQTSQYPNPNRQTMWNNLTDGIHTWGQTPRQAAWTKMRLHAARSRARFKSINQAKRRAWMQGQNQ
jgi:hypothetical protein